MWDGKLERGKRGGLGKWESAAVIHKSQEEGVTVGVLWVDGSDEAEIDQFTGSLRKNRLLVQIDEIHLLQFWFSLYIWGSTPLISQVL